MKTKILFAISIISIAFYSCNFLSVGSYPNREEYVYEECNEGELIKELIDLKINFPEIALLKFPEIKDSYTDSRKLWYSFYFLNPKSNLIFKTIVQEKKKNETIIGLVAICGSSDLYNWKEINQDLKKTEDKNVKSEFENVILSKLKRKFRKRTMWEKIGIK